MKIEHIAMYVNNLEEVRDFFVKYLGGTSNAEYHNASTDSIGNAYDFMVLCSTACNVTLAQNRETIEGMPNGSENLSIYSDNDIETYRDVLFYVGKVLGGFFVINRAGELELRKYGNTPVLTVERKHRFTSSFSNFITRYTAVRRMQQSMPVSHRTASRSAAGRLSSVWARIRSCLRRKARMTRISPGFWLRSRRGRSEYTRSRMLPRLLWGMWIQRSFP